jgi:hypothetical protein
VSGALDVGAKSLLWKPEGDRPSPRPSPRPSLLPQSVVELAIAKAFAEHVVQVTGSTFTSNLIVNWEVE